MVSESRLDAARKVAEVLSSSDFRAVLRDVKDREGSHPVVVGLASDPCREVFEHVREAGGAAYVAVVENQRLELLCCVLGQGPLPQVAEREDCPIHEATTLGMLVTYLRNYQPLVVCHEVSNELKVQLVDERGPQHVPA